MKNLKTIKCWGIPSTSTEEITIEMNCRSIAAFKEQCELEGIELTGKPYCN